MDAAILRTLARIKRKDPSIYEASKDVFEGAFSASYMLRRTARLSVVEDRGEAEDWGSAARLAGTEGQGTSLFHLIYPSRVHSPSSIHDPSVVRVSGSRNP